jgi:acyl-CoA synthetase (AMP-forming)/AMP-acid ligase II
MTSADTSSMEAALRPWLGDPAAALGSANIAGRYLEQVVRGDQPAILTPQGPASLSPAARPYTSLTYADLIELTERCAKGLAEAGIGHGARVVLMVPPSAELVRLVYALFQVGAVPVLVDPGMGLKNIGRCLEEAEPSAFIGISKAHVARSLAGWGRRTVRQRVTVGKTTGWWGGTTLDRLCDSPVNGDAPFFAAGEHDPAAILFTSGSTGVPKGAVYTHGVFGEQVRQLRDLFGVEGGEIDLCTFPLFALFAPVLGMTSIIPRMDATRPAKVDPREILEPARRFGVSNLFGSPALLNRVGRSLDGATDVQPLPTLRRALSAGAPVSPQILERFGKLLPRDARIFTPYGATEALPVAVIGSDEILQDTRERTAHGAGTCVGRTVPDLDVRIIRISDGPIEHWSDELCLPTGEIGEIVVRGRQVTREYFRRPDLTALAKIRGPGADDVWHRMGDCGYFDDQGRLWFCGRKSQRVVTSGGTLFTDPVEGIFNAHPAVFRSALVGVRVGDDVEPVVCIEREADATMSWSVLRDELLRLAKEHEVTHEITKLLPHRSFPVDIRHNSKIFRERLAPWAASRLRHRGSHVAVGQ